MLKDAHGFSKEETLNKLNANQNGLSTKDAGSRLQRYGKNQIKEAAQKNWLQRFFDQLKDMMNLVLIAAAMLSAFISILEKDYIELVDAGIILFIVILNAIIGLTQESKALDAMQSLKNMNKPYCKVMRNGEIEKIKTEELTIGDIIYIEAGDVIPADVRLLESKRLKIEEAALTGESLPSEKNADAVLDINTALGDRVNCAFTSSVVAYGRGVGVVVAVGMDTEMGKIAGILRESKTEPTPLQKELSKTAKVLSIIVLVVASVIFLMSIIGSGISWDSVRHSFMTAVAIAVAAIPEGLPAVVTIVLAIGVKRMSERNAIIKNLPSVETLGCCQVICSDKTGTLTLNKMTVQQLYTLSNNKFYDTPKHSDTSVSNLIKGLALCNNTVKSHNGLVGDPTETALVAYALYANYNIKNLQKEALRINELPFDSNRKLMTTVHRVKDGGTISYTKGALDMLIKKCNQIQDGDVVRQITKADIDNIKKVNKQMGKQALRVLALGYKKDCLEEELENNLIFVGLVGMIDPPRPEVTAAVALSKKAGMDATMITGDHLDTAIAIAKEIGIYKKGDLAITGIELDELTEEEFLRDLYKYKVFARVSPENKVRIVKAYKSLNVIVAMTGDGVNDAPSIKIADIGVGMGITGTDVSKNVADMVLSDDNFATIVAAVEEGRKVYANIKKATQYLLSANIAEVLSLFVVTFLSLFGTRLMFLSAVMILWINLITDSLPALALGTEKAEKDVMNSPPRKTSASLFSGSTGKNIIIQGLMQTILTLGSFFIGMYLIKNGELVAKQAVTMAFVTLSLIQLFHAYNSRFEKESLFSQSPFSNKFLNLAFLVGVGLTALPLFVPSIQIFFGTTWLNGIQWLVAVGFAVLIIPLVELQKFLARKKEAKGFKT